MKMNIIHLTCEFQKELSRELNDIEATEDFETAKLTAAMAVGLVNGYITMMNCMISKAVNDLTTDMDRQRDHWHIDIYQALINKADQLKQTEMMVKYLKMRDELIKGLEDDDE